jgi:hypothetical protein
VIHALPISSSLNDHSNYIWRRVQVIKLPIMQYSPTPHYFIPLSPKYSHQHPVLKHLSLYFFLNMRDQISHSYKTTNLKTGRYAWTSECKVAQYKASPTLMPTPPLRGNKWSAWSWFFVLQ